MCGQPDTGQLVAVRIDPDGTITLITTTAPMQRPAAASSWRRCPVSAAASCGFPQTEPSSSPATIPPRPCGSSPATEAASPTATRSPGPVSSPAPPAPTASCSPVPSWILDTASAIATRRSRRFPMAPLEEWLNARYRNHTSGTDRQCRGRLSTERIAELIGFTRQAVGRWHADGVPRWSADRAAINAGTHPLEVWPDFHSDTDAATTAATHMAAQR